VHALAVADVGQDQVDRRGHVGPGVVQVRLVVVEQQQPRGTEVADLLGDLRPDRAPGTGDEHRAVADRGPDAVDVGGHLGPAEQVLDLQVAHVPHRRARPQQLAHRRQDLERDPGAVGALHDRPHHRLVGAGDGHEHLVGPVAIHDVTQSGSSAHNGNAQK
jgi:hypothetical protein